MEGNLVRQQLFEAVFSGNLAVVKQILAANPMSSRWSSPEQVPLIVIAVQRGHLEIVRFLVEHKARLNWLSSAGDETLYSLSKRLGYDTIALYLRPLMDDDLQKLADSRNEITTEKGEISKPDQNYEIFDAIINNDIVKIKRLLSIGVDVNIRFENDITPLIAAISTRNLDIVKILVQSGADPNKLNGDFESPLLIAYDSSLHDIALYLEPLTSPAIRALIQEQRSTV